MSNKDRIEVQIAGMTCGSCEILLERKLKKIPGVSFVKVNHRTGKAVIHFDGQKPDFEQINAAISGTKYQLVTDSVDAGCSLPSKKNTFKDYVEIFIIAGILFDLYLVLKPLNLFDSGIGITENMSYGVIFLIGLVAASSSCIAVTGGVLLSLAARYNETFQSATRLQKFKPHLFFNVGRIFSYTLLGGLLGALGSMVSVSARVTGIIGIVASLFMILMGMKTLKLFPGLTKFTVTMPKFISHRVLNLESKQNKSIPFVMGALTFFLPCGFTQALQLYAISTGNFAQGALVMFFFSLGTLPALLSLSAISSFAKGGFQRYFLKVSGVLVLILGIVNISNGLALAGIKFPSLSIGVTNDVSRAKTNNSTAATATIIDGKQVVEMKVDGYSYFPSEFTVVQGVPVEWRIDGTNAAGCAQVVIAQSIGVSALLPRQGIKTVTFTPREVGDIPFSCSMGMTTRGAAFHVVENTASNSGASAAIKNNPSDINSSSDLANGTAVNSESEEVQRVYMEVSAARGFSPPSHTVKKGIPVELVVDDQINLGGCMGTMTIPDYGIAKVLEIGKNVIRFTPTKTGDVYVVCSMGILQHTFNVID